MLQTGTSPTQTVSACVAPPALTSILRRPNSRDIVPIHHLCPDRPTLASQYMFEAAPKFNSNIADWDVSKVTSMAVRGLSTAPP